MEIFEIIENMSDDKKLRISKEIDQMMEEFDVYLEEEENNAIPRQSSNKNSPKTQNVLFDFKKIV